MRLLRPMRITFLGGLGFVDLEPGALFWVREGDADNWARRRDAELLNIGAIASLGARVLAQLPHDLMQTPDEPEPPMTGPGYW